MTANGNYTLDCGSLILNPSSGAVELGVTGGAPAFFRFQDGTEQSTAYSSTNNISTVLFVSPDGSDAVANGSSAKPFATIQAAHDYANAEFSNEQDVAVVIAPGSYSGFTLTRPRTHLMGIAGLSNATRVIGTVTINPTTNIGGLYNSVFTLEQLLLAPNIGNALVITGNQVLSFFGRQLKIYTDSANQTCVLANNTAAGGIRVFITDSDTQNELSASTTFDLSNISIGAIKRTTAYCGNNTALKFTNCTMTLDSVTANSNSTNTVQILSGVITAGNSTFSNTLTNSNGINISAGATAVVGQCAFDVATGTGYAIKGVTGSVLVHANNIIAYGKNNKISSAMTAIPMATSFTPAA
jgi:hypothetical protein